MALLSLWINVMHICWIKVLKNKTLLTPTFQWKCTNRGPDLFIHSGLKNHNCIIFLTMGKPWIVRFTMCNVYNLSHIILHCTSLYKTYKLHYATLHLNFYCKIISEYRVYLFYWYCKIYSSVCLLLNNFNIFLAQTVQHIQTSVSTWFLPSIKLSVFCTCDVPETDIDKCITNIIIIKNQLMKK